MKFFEALGEFTTMVFIGLVLIIFTPICIVSSVAFIFHTEALNNDHSRKCLLKHKTIKDRLWHAIDTRFLLLSFDHWGAKPLKSSPNRKIWLEIKIRHFEKMLEESWGESMDIYFKEELSKLRPEYKKLVTK